MSSEQPKTRCSSQELDRLRSLIFASKAAQEKIATLKESIEKFAEVNAEKLETHRRRQAKRVRLESQRVEIDKARARVRALQHRRTRMIEQDEEEAREFERLQKEADETTEKLKDTSELDNLRSQYKRITNELVYRRRFMINQLYNMYFSDGLDNAFMKRNCSCKDFDVILGAHLPSFVDKNNHRPVETCAAVSHLINLLESFSFIAGAELLNPITFKGSNSTICANGDDEELDFYQLACKNRPKFREALRYLSENVNHICREIGMSVEQSDRPIYNIRNVMLCITGKRQMPLTYDRPWNNPVALAALVPPEFRPTRPQPLPRKNEEAMRNLSILDVVTANPSAVFSANNHP